jgi:hypothetical protein
MHTDLVFHVSVSDGTNTTIDTVTILVNPAAAAPTMSVAPEQIVDQARLVSLAPTASTRGTLVLASDSFAAPGEGTYAEDPVAAALRQIEAARLSQARDPVLEIMESGAAPVPVVPPAQPAVPVRPASGPLTPARADGTTPPEEPGTHRHPPVEKIDSLETPVVVESNETTPTSRFLAPLWLGILAFLRTGSFSAKKGDDEA